jgi:hypothetical protein
MMSAPQNPLNRTRPASGISDIRCGKLWLYIRSLSLRLTSELVSNWHLAHISKLQVAQKSNLKVLRNWHGGILEGGSFPQGYEEDTGSEGYNDDVI